MFNDGTEQAYHLQGKAVQYHGKHFYTKENHRTWLAFDIPPQLFILSQFQGSKNITTHQWKLNILCQNKQGFRNEDRQAVSGTSEEKLLSFFVCLVLCPCKQLLHQHSPLERIKCLHFQELSLGFGPFLCLISTVLLTHCYSCFSFNMSHFLSLPDFLVSLFTVWYNYKMNEIACKKLKNSYVSN